MVKVNSRLVEGVLTNIGVQGCVFLCEYTEENV